MHSLASSDPASLLSTAPLPGGALTEELARSQARRRAFTRALSQLDASRGAAPSASPFLKWAGGKGQLLEQLLPLVPAFERYFEPFLGGGAMFFAQRPAQATISDANPRLIGCYEVVRDAPAELLALLARYREAHCEAFYYEVRSRYNEDTSASALEQAAMFIYLNKTGYNGLYRENRRGRFNVPFGRYLRPSICDESLMRSASEVLQSARLRCGGYEESLQDAGPGDFVYLDPPYQPVSPTARFTSYFRQGFGEAEQRALARCYRQLHERGCKLMLSNSDAALIRELYEGFAIHEVQANRAISRNGQGRGPVTEFVVVNYPLPGR